MTAGTVYAVASGKGGVGKTTTAINLGASFADAGRSVVVVDMDLGMANLGDFVEATPAGPTLHEVLAGEATLDDALSHVGPNLDVILGADDLDLFGRADPSGIRTLLTDLRDRYDVVVLDSGGGLSHDTALPLGLADAVVLVSTMEEPAVKNTAKTLELADILEGSLEGIVLTRVGGGKSEVDPTDIAAELDLSLLGSVPEDSTVKQAAASGEPLLTFDRDSPAAQAYLEIAYDLLGESLPVQFGEDRGGPGIDVETGERHGAQDGADQDEGPEAVEEATETSAGAPPEPDEADPESSAGDEAEAAAGEGADTAAAEEAESDVEAATEADQAADAADIESEADEEAPLAEPVEEDDEEESRSFLSKITGGLLG